ncbi:MAG: hypothetical protein RJA98_2526, partial [Pseudomonadota bacterium]
MDLATSSLPQRAWTVWAWRGLTLAILAI